MSAAVCLKCGAASTDAEFCSECGAALAVATPVAVAVAAGDACPVCGEARPGASARFCDNCRYDFVAQMPFSAAPAPVKPAPAEPEGGAAAIAVGTHWDLHAAVDLTLRQPDDPMPGDARPRIYPLDLSDHLIGRRSDKADIHPEIVIDDPGISRRHARILRGGTGGLSLLDLGSTNGTRLDGVAVEPNVPVPLAQGSEVTLGCWTRLVVRAR